MADDDEDDGYRNQKGDYTDFTPPEEEESNYFSSPGER